MLGTDEPLEDGFFVNPPQHLTATDALDVLPDLLAPLVIVGVTLRSAVRFLRRRSRRAGEPAPPDDAPTPLPPALLAVALCGDEFLVGNRGRVLRRVPADELISTFRRPQLVTELTVDGQSFVAAGVEGDIALRLQRVRGAGRSGQT